MLPKGGFKKRDREKKLRGSRERALSNDFKEHGGKGKNVHLSLLSWALANDNLSSYLFLDNEIQSPVWPDEPLQAMCNILFGVFCFFFNNRTY